MRKVLDRYTVHGAKQESETIDGCTELVRQKYPKATKEGSTGFEYSFWDNDPRYGKLMVAHAWANTYAGIPRVWYVRVFNRGIMT